MLGKRAWEKGLLVGWKTRRRQPSPKSAQGTSEGAFPARKLLGPSVLLFSAPRLLSALPGRQLRKQALEPGCLNSNLSSSSSVTFTEPCLLFHKWSIMMKLISKRGTVRIKSVRACQVGGTSGKQQACPCGRCKIPGFDSWVRKIPWRRKWQPTPVFLPGESPWTEEPGGLQSIGSQRVRHN